MELQEFKHVPVVGSNPLQDQIINKIKNSGYKFNYLMHAPKRSLKRMKTKVFPMNRKDRNVLAIEPNNSGTISNFVFVSISTFISFQSEYSSLLID